MQSRKSALIVIVGPTASGKSELAVKLAKTLRQSSGRGGEIISADSRQIYRGLDIGTGKVTGTWRAGHPERSEGSYGDSSAMPQNDKRRVFIYKSIPHHCIDFVSPRRTFTVAKYKNCAEQAIKDVTSRGKIPILVGGTGFWIDTVVYDLDFPQVPPNQKLRQKLEKKSAAELLQMLLKLDPERAKTIEQKNPRRLIRAIEIAKALGKVPKIKKRSPYDALWIGLSPPYEARPRKIKRRIKEMVEGGLVGETKKLLKKGVGKNRVCELGFEYRAALEFIAKKVSRQELLRRLVRDTLEYARRQMVWWKRNPNIQWFSPNNINQIKKTVRGFLISRGRANMFSRQWRTRRAWSHRR